jgi:hypothetical protein
MRADVDAWIAALQTRHRGAFTNREFLKAVRALSARYVERRHELPDRSPLDSAAKRAAFAAFYGPLHFLTVARITAALGAGAEGIRSIADLGCGTGVASAAWAISGPASANIAGTDAHAWAVDEAEWTWRTLGLDGRARRGDMLRARWDDAGAVVLGWSANELDRESRATLLPRLLDAATRGARVLVVEPIGRRVTPWWPDWSAAFTARGGRDDDWRFADALPPMLAELNDAAGFRREELTARSLYLAPGKDAHGG